MLAPAGERGRSARLAASVGDAQSSDRTLREALDFYRAIGATGHVERLDP